MSNDLVGIEVVAAHAGLAESLALAPGGAAVRIERLRRIDGEVAAFMRSFIPESLHPNLMARIEHCDSRTPRSAGVLEQSIGIRPHAGHRWVQAVVADAEVGGHLGIADGEALLYVESVEDDDRGRRIEYSQAWHRGDRTRLELESSRPD